MTTTAPTVVAAVSVARALADRLPPSLVARLSWDNLGGNVGGFTITRADGATFVLGTGEDHYASATISATLPVTLSADPTGTYDEPVLVAEWPTVAAMLAADVAAALAAA